MSQDQTDEPGKTVNGWLVFASLAWALGGLPAIIFLPLGAGDLATPLHPLMRVLLAGLLTSLMLAPSILLDWAPLREWRRAIVGWLFISWLFAPPLFTYVNGLRETANPVNLTGRVVAIESGMIVRRSAVVDLGPGHPFLRVPVSRYAHVSLEEDTCMTGTLRTGWMGYRWVDRRRFGICPPTDGERRPMLGPRGPERS